MTPQSTPTDDVFGPALARATVHAQRWLAGTAERRVPPRSSPAQAIAAVEARLPEGPTPADVVVDELAALAEPGLMSFGSGRFFGWVVGGTQPAPLAADWMVSAWDQNVGMRAMSPGPAALEDVAGRWLLDLLGLPSGADVGFVTGATSANLTCLAAARDQALRTAGWDVEQHGLAGGPRVRVLVGAERHVSVDLALRYLGLGAPQAVVADEQGRIDPAALAETLAQGEGPTVVCLQAGNIHSGACDPMAQAVAAAHARGAWVHVDGAFGLWAAASPTLAPMTEGLAGADSWATDAHKTLNVPYDCGIAVVADPEPLRRAMGVHAAYLADFHEAADPVEKTPEMSRRARGLPVWAALRALGRSGVADLVDGLARHARAIADGLGRIEGAQVLNDVVFTQVCVAFEDDARTRRVIERVLADGETWMSGSRWRDRDVLRVSVSNAATTDEDVERAVAAVRRAAR
ncbi:pyridoxal phosphate-dependent decarboxylase family protein [Cellulomonas soli]|uniref:pyridoxal phosphate-dependent decarboxylase family protein n=1 Tax=Cellulomonas soli TaxID=931535 RepID=UPI003F873874